MECHHVNWTYPIRIIPITLAAISTENVVCKFFDVLFVHEPQLRYKLTPIEERLRIMNNVVKIAIRSFGVIVFDEQI